MDTLSGSVERITYYNPENGYSVLRLRPEGGRLPGGQPGWPGDRHRQPARADAGRAPAPERAVGCNHPKHGLQFQVEVCEQTLPATVAGIRRYLGSGLIKGIGPRLAERIVARFGDRDPGGDRKPSRAAARGAGYRPQAHRHDRRAWEEQKQVKEIMLFLHGSRGEHQPGGQDLQAVRRPGPGSGADRPLPAGARYLRRGLQDRRPASPRRWGFATDHPSRIEAGMVYALNEMTDDGHVYSPQQLARRSRRRAAGRAPRPDPPALERLAQDDRIRREPVPSEAGLPRCGRRPACWRERPAAYSQPAVYLTPLYYGETGVAERLPPLANALPTRLSDLPPAFVALDPSFSPEQQAAIRIALTQPLSVLTGGPGTGKTTALRALIAALEAGRKRYALASPTGGPPSACPRPPGARPAPSTACWPSARRGLQTQRRRTRCRSTCWWWTKPPCSTCCWPTTCSRPCSRARICCWWAMSTSCPRWGRAMCCAI